MLVLAMFLDDVCVVDVGIETLLESPLGVTVRLGGHFDDGIQEVGRDADTLARKVDNAAQEIQVRNTPFSFVWFAHSTDLLRYLVSVLCRRLASGRAIGRLVLRTAFAGCSGLHRPSNKVDQAAKAITDLVYRRAGSRKNGLDEKRCLRIKTQLAKFLSNVTRCLVFGHVRHGDGLNRLAVRRYLIERGFTAEIGGTKSIG